MSFVTWVSIVSGIVSLLSFSFAIWVWMRSDMRVRELTNTLQSIYEISGDIMWESISITGESPSARRLQSERMVGLASSIHTLSSKYVEGLKMQTWRGADLSTLIERGIVWTLPMLWNVESAADTKEVWLVTPDLKPDISDPIVGEAVGNNLRRGKRYVYFVPDNLSDLSELMARLKENLNVSVPKSRLGDLISVVQIDTQEYLTALGGSGNIAFYFKTDPMVRRGAAFREIVFTQVANRGVFWQKCSDEEADSLYRFLRGKMAK